MGGCATKPKESKAEAAAEASAPPPAPEKEEAAAVGGVGSEESKKVEGEGEAVVDKDKVIVDDDTVDEHGSKRQSLSHLFKENEGKDSTEHDSTQSDPVKQEEPPLNQNPIDVSGKKTHESGKTETSIEQTPRDVLEAPIEIKAEKEVEVATAATGTLTDKATEPPATMENQKTETTEEKKAAEEKVAITSETPEEKTIKEEN
ncbi:uncharacterized protein LOC130780277 [Actinidia eriantha]|uniref:uncharacterized protein LOC130780277 n=1 Tax=Actinidia eriantha TaxID=165200 RepID=UPI002589B4F7|nr:uncharacterized protein LOC130780277 [Actinidia eriantha]